MQECKSQSLVNRHSTLANRHGGGRGAGLANALKWAGGKIYAKILQKCGKFG